MTATLATRCAADGEFRLAARHWTGGFRFALDGDEASVRVVDGVPDDGDPGQGTGVVVLTGPAEVWAKLLSASPPRFATDVAAAMAVGLRRDGDPLAFWQYYPALQRAVELLRPTRPDTVPVEDHGRFDAPVGRYVHVDLDGQDHRIYVEDAGQGIPLLLQHTAGSHSVQWRHLFECSEITERFRLIAYDLPFHGNSLPPVGPRWWEAPYRLTAVHASALPVALADALGLDRPVFMGCSVGGLLALDLAAHHPGRFRAVISLEGALKLVTGEYDHSAPIEAGRAAHEAIENSTFTVMEGLGHFPMSEDPDRFLDYLLPLLRSISTEES